MERQRIKKIDFTEIVWRIDDLGFLIKREYKQQIVDRIETYNSSNNDIKWFVKKSLHGTSEEFRVKSKSEGLRMLNHI